MPQLSPTIPPSASGPGTPRSTTDPALNAATATGLPATILAAERLASGESESALSRLALVPPNRGAVPRAERERLVELVRDFLGAPAGAKIELDTGRGVGTSGALFRDGGAGLLAQPSDRYLRGSVTVNETVTLPGPRGSTMTTTEGVPVEFVIPYPPDARSPRAFIQGLEADLTRSPDRNFLAATARASLSGLPLTGAARIDEGSVALRFQELASSGVGKPLRATVADCYVTGAKPSCFTYMVSNVVSAAEAKGLANGEIVSSLRRWFINPGSVGAPEVGISDVLAREDGEIVVDRSSMSRKVNGETVDLPAIRTISIATWERAFGR